MTHHFLYGGRAFRAESQSLAASPDPVLPLRSGSSGSRFQHLCNRIITISASYKSLKKKKTCTLAVKQLQKRHSTIHVVFMRFSLSLNEYIFNFVMHFIKC